MTQVFISYSRKDLIFVERLAKDLKAAGLEVWYDLSGLNGGTRWGREIQNAIDECQSFVVVLSPNSVESEWVEKEFMYANSLNKKIIPLLYKPCKTPMWFINLHFIDVQGDNYDRNFWIILKALGVKPGEKTIKPEERQAPGLAEETATHKGAISSRKIKFHPAWIIAPLGLMAVAAMAIWGVPPLVAQLAHVPLPTMTAMHMPSSTRAVTWTHMPTPTYIEGPWEQEPNNTYQQANGPLLSGIDYYGYPNDQKDFFIINSSIGGQIVIDLTNHTGQGVQLQLFYQTTTGTPVVHSVWQAPYHIQYTGLPGKYYIYIYTESNYNSSNPYTLRVTYP